MIRMNDMMTEIIKDENGEELSAQSGAILEEIVKKTKKIKDCIIYDDGTLKEEKINFHKIINFFGDMTGYEVSCNELRFERAHIPQNQFLMLASSLSNMLVQKFSVKEMVVYLLLYDDEIELRFHIYRQEEGLWLDKNLNKYNVPILYWL